MWFNSRQVAVVWLGADELCRDSAMAVESRCAVLGEISAGGRCRRGRWISTAGDGGDQRDQDTEIE